MDMMFELPFLQKPHTTFLLELNDFEACWSFFSIFETW